MNEQDDNVLVVSLLSIMDIIAMELNKDLSEDTVKSISNIKDKIFDLPFHCIS